MGYNDGSRRSAEQRDAVKYYRKAAECGDAIAQYNLGNCYFNGDGVEKDEEEAVKWYRKSAEQENASAQYRLGLCYFNGEGVDQDKSEALKWFFKAAEQDNDEAQNLLGDCYFNGDGVEKDEAEAVKWYRKAAEQDNDEAQNFLGDCYFNGDGVEKDEAEAVKWYRKAAEQYNDDAQYKLGKCYFEGLGVEKNEAEAVEWFSKAVDSDNAAAQYMLGCCLYNGAGVDKNSDKAVELFRKLSEAGNSAAKYMLGNCYYNGAGVDKSFENAVEWYRSAADSGNSDAQYMLGNCYYNGDGVDKSFENAVEWYRMAADSGNLDAQYKLGKCCYNGEGVAKNEDEAMKWWRRAADSGNASAQYMLAGRCLTGMGVVRDYSKAVEWYAKSADLGNDAARYCLDNDYSNHLGDCYYYGIGFSKDYKSAYEWYRRAAEQGDVVAQFKLGNCSCNGEVVDRDVDEVLEWWRKSEDLGNVTAEVNRLQHELKELNASSERLGSEKSGLQNELNRLSGELKESNARSERLGSEKSGLQNELNRLSSELKESNARSECLRAEKSGLQNELNRLGGELKESNARSERLGSEKSGLQNELNRLRGELKELNARSERLGSEKSGLQNELNRLRGELKESKARSERLGSEKSGLQNELNRLSGELKESNACSERLGSEKSGLQNELNRLSGELKELNARSECLGFEKSGLQNELNRLGGELKEFKNGIRFIIKNANIGDYVKFGRYPQTAEGEVRPVEWQVLARDNNKALVISRYGLDSKRFDGSSNNWKKSEIRKWLNGEFYTESFNAEEKACIKSFNQDNVFLLSKEEAEKYFADDVARRCKLTSYARAKGAWTGDNGCGSWWLRSPYTNNNVDIVRYVGDFGFYTNGVNISSGSVRPALWINLDGSEKSGLQNEPKKTKKIFGLAFLICLLVTMFFLQYVFQFGSEKSDLQKESKACSERLGSEKNGLESLKSSGSNPFKNAKIGDYVKFGRYPQTAKGEVQPVEWQVLARENNKALVISRYGLAARRFDGSSNNWSKSEIRKWLNSEFYNSTFSGEEKARIKSFNQDNVFLLSKEEAEKYFSDDDARKCKPTSYAKAKGAWTGDDGCGYWWLRSPGLYRSDGVYGVGVGGVVIDDSFDFGSVCNYNGSARPALWINLDELNRLRDEQKESKARSERLGSEKNGLESLKSSGSNPFKNAKIGDFVKFGRYPQTAEGEVRPVEWQVLARENNKALVISRYGLDAKRFDGSSNNWSKSEIRRWLNGEFYNSTFSGEEKARIKSFNQDNVFLLSKEEAEKYFADDDERECEPTSYAKSKGALTWGHVCCCWWLILRSPIYSSDVWYVRGDGDIRSGLIVYNDDGSVRPALWIDLES